jgi:hypothetical protein
METILRQWLKGIKIWAKGERGLGVVESLAAVAVLGTAVVAFIVALSTGSIAAREVDQETVAQSLVRTQLEYIKSFPYDPAATTYPNVDTPEGYTISVEVSSVPDTDTNIQKITVTISREKEEILTVADYKVNR